MSSPAGRKTRRGNDAAGAARNCGALLRTRLPDASMKWQNHPNLQKRPAAPAKNRGRVQRAIRRAFAASGAEVLSSSAIYDWAHVRRRLGRRKSMPFWAARPAEVWGPTCT
jgi:hypothetical protein